MKVSLSAIQFDPATQPRVQMDLFVVREYGDAMVEGAEFPPVSLFEEDGLYWIGDGFHRCQAARDLGLVKIEADVQPGGKAEAIWASCAANAVHGLRRTNADKRRSVERALAAHSELSDREIAKHCGVEHHMVSDARPRIWGIPPDSGGREVTRGAQTYIMQTGNIGKPVGEGLTEESLELGKRLDEIRQNRQAEKRIEGLPADLQLRVLNLVSEGATTAKAVRTALSERLGDETPDLPDDVFDLILADPPWQYDFSLSSTRQIENQYPPMPLEQIKLLPVPELAHANAVLFIWATSPKVPEALEVIEAWGFTYKTCMVWVKDQIGMGYWARQKHELLFIATRGSPTVPDEADRPESVVLAPRRQHSEKPEETYAVIEAMLPNAKRIELFARQRRDGWTPWGKETGD